jgi:penicillin amidase
LRRGARRLGYALAVSILLIGVCGAIGCFWLRTSLPQVDGEIALKGLGATTTIARDDRGVITIKAASANDAYFAMGFAHAQDRLFQMDAMRRLGAGRLSEVFGAATVDTDKLTRTLGLYAQAESQVAEASPGLRQALDAYAAGVNAFLDTRHGALPPEFVLLNYRPESWKPADSLVWGRIMALQLSGNYIEEQLNLRLKKSLKPELFGLLLPATRSAAALPGFYGPLNAASNNWVVGPARSSSGKPMLANDPHLGLGAPSIWYLAHIVTPQMNWLGATSPGMPILVIGANDHVAWGFTTTQSDTEDLFEEKLVDGKLDQYQTPAGPKAFDIRHEIVKVKGEADVAFDVRSTRHGPVISDLDEKPKPEDPILALAWAATLPEDRTADALYEMNMATSAATFETALMDFHAPQQNVVYVDAAGKIGFVAAGRVPVRRAIYKGSQLPAPGWSGDYDWIGTLPFENLPHDDGGTEGWIATANNKTVSSDYPYFITGEWPSDDRFQRIRSMLRAKEKFSTGDFERMQQDILSQPLKDLIQSWLPETGDAEPTIRDMLATWDGRMDRNRAEPLIATLWLDRAARRIFGDELGEDFDAWWFWRIDLLNTAIADGKACDDVRTAEVETCSFEIGAAFIDTLKDLRSGYGANVENWHWGKAHRAHVTHPIFRQIPVLGSLLDADLPTGGDFFTVNRGAAFGHKGALEFPHVHGPTMRLVVDMANPMAAEITLAGGESGNPLSPHYADWLTDWRDGRYRTIVQPAQHMLTLKPQ